MYWCIKRWELKFRSSSSEKVRLPSIPRPKIFTSRCVSRSSIIFFDRRRQKASTQRVPLPLLPFRPSGERRRRSPVKRGGEKASAEAEESLIASRKGKNLRFGGTGPEKKGPSCPCYAPSLPVQGRREESQSRHPPPLPRKISRRRRRFSPSPIPTHFRRIQWAHQVSCRAALTGCGHKRKRDYLSKVRTGVNHTNESENKGKRRASTTEERRGEEKILALGEEGRGSFSLRCVLCAPPRACVLIRLKCVGFGCAKNGEIFNIAVL